MWDLDFISESDFENHVRKTIENYRESLKTMTLKDFNKNIIDPVKFAFDKALYGISWQELINNEITRQRDKTNNNYIGYFHQHIFKYIDKCSVPPNGKDGGWDVIFRNPDGLYFAPNDESNELVHTIYVEMKNKHNTMNSSSAERTYKKMQQQLCDDDDCACYLVEAIANESQNVIWETSVEKKKVHHKRIRRVSIDQFYNIVTGQSDAFYKVCMKLPEVIAKVAPSMHTNENFDDTVYSELKNEAKQYKAGDEDVNLTLAMYMLGFSSYLGFNSMN
ncbi:Eco47II restriction endonuclease [Fibrobacter intestinalis]|uniref:Eco47II restriction endonuclease n=2 Tax=Fibrobacter TaxID=832 RepID=A0A1M6V2X2_9BACT|nr:Eco47II family restriction endonuclease [Fibrobacter intestinalis]SHK75800.1 Eco47II restriction endonuclease [Fibrobacter intestinalis]